MPNFAIIENGKVINVVVANADYATEKGWVLIPADQNAGVDWDYDGVNFINNRPSLGTIEMPSTIAPTKEELIAQLNSLAAQIQALN